MKRLIVVESADEERLLEVVLVGAPSPSAVEIKPLKGVDPTKLRVEAEVVRNRPDFPDLVAIGLVIDAEDDVAAMRDAAGTFFDGLGLPRPGHGEVLPGAEGRFRTLYGPEPAVDPSHEALGPLRDWARSLLT